MIISILTAMTVAVIPWAIALPVLRWHPGMQAKPARRTYRWATYAVALFFTLFVVVPALALLWFIPVGLAVFLDIHWYRISRTRAGQAALAFAKDEARPRGPNPGALFYLPAPPYLDYVLPIPDELIPPPERPAVQPPA